MKAIGDRSGPDFAIEDETKEQFQFNGSICGIDEAGRGPFAGPVTAAAVVLNPNKVPEGLNDSKKLSESERDRLFEEILSKAQVGVGQATVQEIDNLNILQATFLAMRRATENLPEIPGFALIDGNQMPRPFPCNLRTVVKGDAKSLSIAAASIVAKVTRDRIMVELDSAFPEFGWARNKGYGTRDHTVALKQHGPSPHHRKSFKPVRQLLPEIDSLVLSDSNKHKI